MTIEKTGDGHLKLHITDEFDFHRLSELVQDATGEESEFSIVDQVGQHIAEDDWEEFTKPELKEKFQTDIASVAKVVKAAYEADAQEILVSPQEARNWYSTINQALLHLESRYQLSRVDLEPELDNLSESIIHVILRADFYQYLQSYTLEIIPWEI